MYVGNPLPLENDGSHNQLLYFGKERKRKKMNFCVVRGHSDCFTTQSARVRLTKKNGSVESHLLLLRSLLLVPL